MPRPKLLLQRLVLAAAGFAFSLVVAEIGVRVLFPQNLILIRPDVWLPHDRYGWATAPGVDVEMSAGESRIRLRTDAAGNRIGADVRAAAAVRILGVGDSFLQAVEVDYEDTLGAFLEEQLGAAGGRAVDVVNSGVSGWSPSQYLLKVEDELANGGYDAVIVFFYLGNDFVKRHVEDFEPRAPSLRHEFRLPRDASSRELVAALLYPMNDFLEERSHLFAFVRDRSLLLRMRLGLSRIRMPPLLDRRMRLSPVWEVTAEICAAIARAGEGAGVPVLFALLPSIHEVDRNFVDRYVAFLGMDPSRYDPDQPSVQIGRRLRRRGLQVVDVTPAMRAAYAAGGERLYDRVTIHFSSRGHEVAAAAIAPALEPVLERALERAKSRHRD